MSQDAAIAPQAIDPETIAGQCVRFARFLRSQGIATVPAQTVAFLQCLAVIDIADRRAFCDAARAVFVQRYEHLAPFELAFERFWRPSLLGPPRPSGLFEDRRQRADVWALDVVTPADDPARMEQVQDRAGAYSATAALRKADFATLSATEEAQLLALMRRHNWHLPLRRSRRLTPDRRGAVVDLRRSLRRSLARGGDPLPLQQRSRVLRPRPLVLLCDVSGSMERYTRILLQFVYALAGANDKVEAFVFSTELTRITPQVRRQGHRQSPGATLDAAIAAARDVGGGTRIGAALRTFNSEWARRVRAGGATVLIISDGCDRGDPTLLGAEAERLHRSCRRLLWLNPWLGQADYRPATRGLQAALPHVDEFLPAHNLASLEELVRAVNGWPAATRK